MDQNEIKREIDNLFNKLQEVMDPAFLEYTKEIREINERISAIQKYCKHVPNENNYCIFCHAKVT